MAKKKVDGDGFGKPALMNGRLAGARVAIQNIGDAIYVLDLSIKKWIEQLNRAQPHRNERLSFLFTAHSCALVEGERVYDIEPVPGKMILMKSGTWKFFMLTSKDVYTKLSDLRVGKSLPSDPLVIRLIDGIEDMLKQREFMVEILVSFRIGLPGKLDSIQASSARRYDEAIDLSRRVKLDWSLGAALAEKTIKAQRSARNIVYKARKQTKAETSS